MLPEAEKGMDTQAVSKVVKEIEEEIAREEERREQEEKSVHDPGPGKKEESGAPEKRNMHTGESDGACSRAERCRGRPKDGESAGI